ncbi:unnamed protein product [Blepharisma stoltei]|uniref:EGF-like domain-containing protein n=1 Tax=Blepharisma stoltei TaxID=1481888 RepID=A0AAU9IDA3_9CILI|nr:unnamed protein product [Blepharisma stoltei]
MKFIVLALIPLCVVSDLVADFILSSSNLKNGNLFISTDGNFSIYSPQSIYSDDAYVPKPTAIGTYFHGSTYLYRENFPSAFKVTHNFSIKLWVYFINNLESSGTVFALSSPTNTETPYPLSIYQQQGSLYLSTTLIETSSFPVDLGIFYIGIWKLIILTSSEGTDNSGEVNIYAPDGTENYPSLHATAPYQFPLNATQLNFGFRKSSFIGFLFEAAIYNSELLSADFSQFYTSSCEGCSFCDPSYNCLDTSKLYPAEKGEYPGFELCDKSCNYYCENSKAEDCFCDNELINIKNSINYDEEENKCCSNQLSLSQKINKEETIECCGELLEIIGSFDSENNLSESGLIIVNQVINTDDEDCGDINELITIRHVISEDYEEECEGCLKLITITHTINQDKEDEDCLNCGDTISVNAIISESEEDCQTCDSLFTLTNSIIDDFSDCLCEDFITLSQVIREESDCEFCDFLTFSGELFEEDCEFCSSLFTISQVISEEIEENCSCNDWVTTRWILLEESDCDYCSNHIALFGWLDNEDNTNCSCDNNFISINGTFDYSELCCDSQKFEIEGIIFDDSEEGCCSNELVEIRGILETEEKCCKNDLIEIHGSLLDDGECCSSNLFTISGIILEDEECCLSDLITIGGMLIDEIECCDTGFINVKAMIFDESDCCTTDLLAIEVTIFDEEDDQNYCCSDNLMLINGYIYEEDCCTQDMISLTGTIYDECCSSDLITISSIVYDEDDDNNCCISDFIKLNGFMIDYGCCDGDLIALSAIISEEEFCCESDLIKISSAIFDEESCCEDNLVTLQGELYDSEDCCSDSYISLHGAIWNNEETCCDGQNFIALNATIYDEEECSDCSSYIKINSNIYDVEDCGSCSDHITINWKIDNECPSCSESQTITLKAFLYDEEDCNSCLSSIALNATIDSECSSCSDLISFKFIISYDEDDCIPSCNSGEFYNGTQCEACGELCASCISKENCTVCEDPINMKIDSENPGNCFCKDGTFYNGATCESCKPLCEVCAEDGSCLKCNGLHLILKDGMCECESGYYLANGICTQCGLFCKECSNNGTCITCNDKNTMKFSVLNPEECECISGTYSDGETCHSCGSFCAECTDSITCLSCTVPSKMKISTSTPGTCECSSGFFKSSNSCSACTNLCSTCSSETSCTTCVANTNPISSNTCTCKDGYFKSSNSCKSCPSLCTTCSNSTICSSCVANAALNVNSMCACSSDFSVSDDSLSCLAQCNYLCTSCDKNDGKKCSACVSNAELLGNTCSCTENSVYDSGTKSCVCNSGYTLVNSKCVTCKNYFSSSDVVSISFTSTYTAILIEFKYYLDTSVDSSCSKTVASTSLAKLGTNPSCSWTDNKYLKITLGTDYLIRSEILYLDGTNILRKYGTCSVNYQALSGTVQLSTTASISAVISGQTSLSLTCGSDPLVYSGEKSYGSAGLGLTYSWSSTISPQISTLSTYISSQSSSKISISRSYFSTSVTTTLTVSLTVTNKFGNKSTSSITTIIEPSEALTVAFDQGNSISILASDSKTIKASVKTQCGSTSESISWEWDSIAVDGSPTYDSASILSKSKSPNKLEIAPNSLPAGGTYKFRAIATQTVSGVTYTGNSTITIATSHSPLVIALSRSSGSISPSQDFVVSGAGSYDPDDATGSLNYTWSCVTTDSDSTCVGADNSALVINEIGASLTIPSSKLVKGASYDLTLKISKDTRSSSSAITISVLNANTDASISIALSSQKVNPQAVVSLKAAVEVSSEVSITWSEISGSSISISPNNLPTVSFKVGTLSEGSSYTFQLSVFDTSINLSLTIEMPVTTNSGGSCTGSVSISPDSGQALITSFSISISGCVDKDEEDYPILYKYTDTWNSKTYKLSSTTESNSVTANMYPGDNTVVVYVCDQLNTCSSYSKSITVENYSARFLQTTSLLSLYKQAIIDPDQIPSAITLFCSSATIDSTLFSTMWSDLQLYVSENTASSDLLNDAMSSIFALTGQTSIMSSGMFDIFIEYLENYETTNNIMPTSDTIKYAVDITNNYLTFGETVSFNGSSIESYIVKTNTFIQLFVKKFTSNDLVSQQSLGSDVNTDTISLYKLRDFPTSFSNSTLNFTDHRSISFPSSLPFKDTDITNLRANYYTYSDDYSDVAEISFGLSGNYSNYTLIVSDENDYDYKAAMNPISIELPFYKNVSIAWRCLYYNQTTSAWQSDSTCKIKEVKNSSVVVETTHLSMYKLGDTPNVPPDPFIPPSYSCEDNNYPAIYILSVVVFIGIIFIPVAVIADRAQNTPEIAKKGQESSLTQRYLINETCMTSMVPPNSPKEITSDQSFGSPSQLVEPDEEEVKEDSPPSSDDDVVSMGDIGIDEPQYTEKSHASEIEPTVIPEEMASATKTEKSQELKRKALIMIEGHLAFGLVFYRSEFSRVLRLLTLTAIIIFELLLEGLFLYGFETIDEGSQKSSTKSVFENYEPNYFGYTILSIAIAMLIEVYLIIAFSIDKKKTPYMAASGILVAATILFGSIIGTVWLSYKFCHDWNGYWAASFLFGILVEIFVMQTIYMLFRYLFLENLPESKKEMSLTKSFTLA